MKSTLIWFLIIAGVIYVLLLVLFVWGAWHAIREGKRLDREFDEIVNKNFEDTNGPSQQSES